MRTILVTGASGVVGKRVVPRLAAGGHHVVSALREGSAPPEGGSQVRRIGDIGPSTDWRGALQGVDTVVHLAARTPGRGVRAEELELVNSLGTERLVQQATEAGVRVVVFVSSVFAVVDNSWPEPVDEDTRLSPSSGYGRSKQTAEAHVRGFAGRGRSAVILRPPLVHAPDAKGNWRLLQRFAASRIPLPFGSARNRRSVISAGHLADAIAAVIERSDTEAVDGTYMVADDPPLSTGDIVRHMRIGMDRGPGLVSMPVPLMALPLRIAGKKEIVDSLFGDLLVDSRLFRETFGWNQGTDSSTEIERSTATFAKLRE